MNPNDLVINPEQGITWELGGAITCKVAGSQTADSFSMLLISLKKGQGARLHIHQREDEVFYILEGTCTFGIGDEVITAKAGTTVYLKKGLPHFFRNDDEALMKAIITAVPGGLDRYFEEVVTALATGNPEMIDKINQTYEIKFF